MVVNTLPSDAAATRPLEVAQHNARSLGSLRAVGGAWRFAPSSIIPAD